MKPVDLDAVDIARARADSEDAFLSDEHIYLRALRNAYPALAAELRAAREALRELSADEIRLAAGELTAGEMRAVKAILKWRLAAYDKTTGGEK